MNQIEHINQIFKLHKSQKVFPDISSRKENLRKIRDWLLNHKHDIYEAMHKDLRKPESEVDLAEIWYILSEIKIALRNLEEWSKPQSSGVSSLALITARAWTQAEPKGCVLIIAPWNFPFNLSIGPLVSALAAGNRVIIKPSELTPNVSGLIESMVNELFDDSVVKVFQGAVDTAQHLLTKPFDHIFFTGSPAVGKIVMNAAANHLSSITLELGGKSPVIIDETAHINMAVEKLVWGKCFNMGQSCIAPDYILVHSSKYDSFLSQVKQRIKNVFGETPEERQASKDMARIVNEHHFDRVKSIIEKALSEGATIFQGGLMDKNDLFIDPVFLHNVSNNMEIMDEEIFGPILPVLPFDSLDECVEIINNKPKPLALYLFSSSWKNKQKITQETSSGGMVINEVKSHFLNLKVPFGGVNNSGIGRSHGYAGFRAFSNDKTMLENGRLSTLKIIFPPYNNVTKKLIKLVTKYL